MRSLKEYISHFENITIHSFDKTNEWSEKFLEFLKNNNDNPNYEYLIGIKDYLSGSKNKNFIFLFKENDQIQGYAALTLKKIVQDKKIRPVCYINEIIFSKDVSSESKLYWENTFIKIIDHKSQIIELCKCEFFYTLSLGEKIDENSSLKRLKRAVKVSHEEQFKIYNIFTKKYLATSVPQYNLTYSTPNDLEDICKFIIEQKHKKSRDLNAIPDVNEIRNAINEGRLFYIKDFSTHKIMAICLCDRTKLRKEYFHKLDSKFKLSSSILPLMGRGAKGAEEEEEFSNLFIKLIEINQDFYPNKKTEIVKSIIANLFKIKEFKDTLVFTIPSFDDLSIENAMKSYFCVETNLREITFNDFEFRHSSEFFETNEEQRLSTKRITA